MEYPTLSPFTRALTAKEFCAVYGIRKDKLEDLIHAGRIKTVEGSLPMRVYDPLWAAAFGLSPVSSEQIPLLQCGEMADLLGLTARTIRYIADQGKLPFQFVGKRRLYSVAALRQALEERERREKGRRNSGVRPWLVEWAKQQLRTRPLVRGRTVL